jgi:hypothetical protein
MHEPTPDAGDERQESELERELQDWLPRRGDRLVVATDAGLHLDPLGLTPHGEPRNPIGRWRLYTDGYLSAADRLVDSCIGRAYEDELIYPVLALYRHHLELKLKYVLRACPGFTQELEAWLASKHDLSELWERMTEIYPRFSEWTSAECTEACAQLVAEFNSHDPTSQAARYPVDRRGNQALANVESIDPGLLRRGVHKISRYLEAVIEQIGQDLDWEAEMAGW